MHVLRLCQVNAGCEQQAAHLHGAALATALFSSASLCHQTCVLVIGSCTAFALAALQCRVPHAHTAQVAATHACNLACCRGGGRGC